MKFSHFETQSGRKIKTAQFDGYQIAERLLEGVTFQVTIQEDGTLKASVIPQDEDYFEQFNTAKFLKMAEDYVAEGDEYEDPETGEACWIINEKGETTFESKPKPIPITMTKLTGPTETDSEEVQEEEQQEKVIGKFKPKRKFLNFLQGRKGGIRVHSNTALLEGKQLSGMLEDVYFKVTICDEGTIDFEEVDTNQTNDEMIQRFIDDIDSRDVTGYMKKYVVYGIDFKDENGKKMYLEVEEERPIDKLFAIFDEAKETKEDTGSDNSEDKGLSQSGLSILDSLFGDDGETETEETETENQKEEPMSFAQQMMADAFAEMNREKIEELEGRADKKEQEMKKYEMTYKSAQTSFENTKKELRVLKSRLEDLKPKASPNGIIFYVSPETKSELNATDEVKDIVNKISEQLNLKSDVVLTLVTEGYYTIKLVKKDDIKDPENSQIDKEVLIKLKELNTFGKLSMVGNNEFEFRGDLNWHQIVDKLINWGFEQNEEWDELCGSPSYKSTSSIELVTATQSNTQSVNDDINDEEENDEEENEVKSVHYITYNKPTTLVVLDTTMSDHSSRGIEVTDDESSFSLFVNGKKKSEYGCLGFINILTLDEFNEIKKKSIKDGTWEDGFGDGIIQGFVVPNFIGSIGVVARNEDTGKFHDEFDLSDYIQHQLYDIDSDAYFEVGLNFPEGTQTFNLNPDLSLPLSILRDKKIDLILS